MSGLRTQIAGRYEGIRINVVSKLLGHKDVATTYKIYIHLIPEEMDEAVDAVGKVMMGG